MSRYGVSLRGYSPISPIAFRLCDAGSGEISIVPVPTAAERSRTVYASMPGRKSRQCQRRAGAERLRSSRTLDAPKDPAFARALGGRP